MATAADGGNGADGIGGSASGAGRAPSSSLPLRRRWAYQTATIVIVCLVALQFRRMVLLGVVTAPTSMSLSWMEERGDAAIFAAVGDPARSERGVTAGRRADDGPAMGTAEVPDKAGEDSFRSSPHAGRLGTGEAESSTASLTIDAKDDASADSESAGGSSAAQTPPANATAPSPSKTGTADAALRGAGRNATDDQPTIVERSQPQRQRNDNRTTAPAPPPPPPPSYNETDVQRRAPYFLILGAQKGGTTSLQSYLKQHPLTTYLADGKRELNFFTWRLGPYLLPGRNDDGTERIQIPEARKAHSHFYQRTKLESNPSLVGFDSTPDYLFQSDLMSTRVRAVNPDAKLLVVLRNPVDRAYSDYTMEHNRGRTKGLTFEQYVDADLDRLRNAGFVRNWNASSNEFDEFAGSTEEDEAWSKYWRTNNRGMHPIGRGLYAVQLRQWFRTYGASSIDEGRLRDKFLVIDNADLRGANGTRSTVNRIVDFLGLPPFRLKSVAPAHVGRYTKGRMNATTRERLEEFYRPYNRQLGALLGSDWDGVWETTRPRDGT